jgi:orotate phosphoribosyltransferase
MDMTSLKISNKEAKRVAGVLADNYTYNTVINTIVCMDGCEVIGTHLAEGFTHSSMMIMNEQDTIHVITPEFDPNGLLIFRDNLQPMIHNKNVLLLLASATTGKTIAQSLECIEYYGGRISGISAIFCAVDEIRGHKINYIFGTDDMPDYKTYKYSDCPQCANKQSIDAIVNGYGYSEL